MSNIVLGKVVNKNVAKLQKLYMNEDNNPDHGPTSTIVAKNIHNFVVNLLHKNVKVYFDEDLVSFTMSRIYDRIIPKLDDDGKYRCFFRDPRNGKKCPGYIPSQANLGSYIIGVVTWSVRAYFYKENKWMPQLQYNTELDKCESRIKITDVHDFNFKVIDIDDVYDNDDVTRLVSWLSISKRVTNE